MPPSEREMRTIQEERLYDILLLEKFWHDKKPMEFTFSMIGEKAQSGMTADEIDAVRERVNRAYAKHK